MNESEFARHIAARLTEGLESVPPVVRDRLAGAREAALVRARASPARTPPSTSAGVPSAPDVAWWGPRLFAPALGLVAALLAMLYWQQTRESPPPALYAEHAAPAPSAEASAPAASPAPSHPETSAEQPAPGASAEQPAPRATAQQPPQAASAEQPAQVPYAEPLPGVEAAEVDADVLAEELPVTAYLDQGFEVWLYHATAATEQP